MTETIRSGERADIQGKYGLARVPMRFRAALFTGVLLIGALSFAVVAPGSAWAGTAPTSTALTLSAPTVRYADEQAEQMSVTVSAPSGTPTGTVMLSWANGGPVCSVTLVSGQGSCSPDANATEPATVTVVASYGGDANFAASVSAAQTFTVAKDPTTSTVSLSTPAVTYGHEQPAQVTAQVTPEFSLWPSFQGPTGRFGFTGIDLQCYLGLGGVCWFALGATSLPAGIVAIGGSYPGDTNYAASSAAPQMLTVARATSKTALTVSASTIRYGHEQAERLAVRVSPEYAGTPGGRVTVKAGTLTVCVITLTSGSGGCTFTAFKLRAGTYRLVAAYSGSTDFKGSASAQHVITVLR